MTRLEQALASIISNWEFQNECCERLFPTTTDYALAYSKLTGLRQALDELKFAGVVTYINGKWEVASSGASDN